MDMGMDLGMTWDEDDNFLGWDEFRRLDRLLAEGDPLRQGRSLGDVLLRQGGDLFVREVVGGGRTGVGGGGCAGSSAGCSGERELCPGSCRTGYTF
ncbi:hypothetical protein E4U41_001630, partial [Claviceps citrina]